MTQKRHPQRHDIDVQYRKERPVSIEVARRRSLVGGLAAGAALSLALTTGVNALSDTVERQRITKEYSQPGFLQSLIDNGEIDPRNATVIEEALQSDVSDVDFEPLEIALKDGSAVVVDIVKYGDNPTSLAKELAPNVGDPTNIARIITGQAALEGDSSQLQQGLPIVVPSQFIER